MECKTIKIVGGRRSDDVTTNDNVTNTPALGARETSSAVLAAQGAPAGRRGTLTEAEGVAVRFGREGKS